jgi:catechol 2,3-dioxygenase-like lactoylglutathione lyase family enzyme
MNKEIYDVGGVRYQRPFKIRRLGHFGFNVHQLDTGLDFYGRKLGFLLTDETRLGKLLPDMAANMEDDRLYFMTNNSDHHSFLLAHHSLGAMFGDDAGSKDITLSQLTFQVGTLEEVINAVKYFDKRGVEIRRSGRDMPGSNWHVYVRDLDGHTVELYYGMEQIGLLGRSKPDSLYDRRFMETAPLPQISDLTEREQATRRGVDISSGYQIHDLCDESPFNVGGVLLPRPFKVTKIGPAGLFVNDVSESEEFYQQVMGFVTTEIVEWKGHRCVFMRHGNDHHSLKLYPKSLRNVLGLSSHTSCVSMGMQLGSYKQLRDAVEWLTKQDVKFIELPAELNPGIECCAHIQDPEGHCIQLYYHMEQIGWDGRVRPPEQRRNIQQPWPETLDALSDTYVDQIFQGPLG